MDESRIKQLWKTRETALSTLNYRGYDTDDIHMSYQEFLEVFNTDSEKELKEEMELCIENDYGKTMVFWPLETKINQNINFIKEKMDENDCTVAIVIVDNSITIAAKSIISNYRKEKIYIDVFYTKNFTIDIMKHKYVPEHIICSLEEKENVYSSYNIDSSSETRILPNILSTDPIIKIIGGRKGDVIKIIRDSETMKGHKTLVYRIVV